MADNNNNGDKNTKVNKMKFVFYIQFLNAQLYLFLVLLCVFQVYDLSRNPLYKALPFETYKLTIPKSIAPKLVHFLNAEMALLKLELLGNDLKAKQAEAAEAAEGGVK